jgi:predicted nuclease of restriction endonuclease-like (RecB) superfamily
VGKFDHTFIKLVKNQMKKNIVNTEVNKKLFDDIRNLIEESKSLVATTVNSSMTMLFWNIGERVNRDILNNKRAEYGEQIVVTLSRQLVWEYGNSFEEKNLRRMVQFATVFPDEKIVVTLSRYLSWSHFISLIPLKQPLQREFYAEMCRIEKWGVRTLRQKIDSMLYERTAISKKPNTLIKREIENLRENDILTPDLVFRDPYLLNFLGLKNSFTEKALEDAILRELEKFILELGQGFTFIERQKRMIIDNEDFNLDLLFFHRKLKRMIAIDLKLGKFKAAFKGQMELYLRYLEKYEMQPGEKSPLGLILCAEGNKEQIELLQLDKSGIKVAEYLAELPDKKLLQQKLHKAIEVSKKRLEIE